MNLLYEPCETAVGDAVGDATTGGGTGFGLAEVVGFGAGFGVHFVVDAWEVRTVGLVDVVAAARVERAGPA